MTSVFDTQIASVPATVFVTTHAAHYQTGSKEHYAWLLLNSWSVVVRRDLMARVIYATRREATRLILMVSPTQSPYHGVVQVVFGMPLSSFYCTSSRVTVLPKSRNSVDPRSPMDTITVFLGVFTPK
jgi:uncharacterized membrane protein YbaN (DUF454 family)